MIHVLPHEPRGVQRLANGEGRAFQQVARSLLKFVSGDVELDASAMVIKVQGRFGAGREGSFKVFTLSPQTTEHPRVFSRVGAKLAHTVSGSPLD